jgi:hypothetical protein
MEAMSAIGETDRYNQKHNSSRTEADLLHARLTSGAYRASRIDLQVVWCGVEDSILCANGMKP